MDFPENNSCCFQASTWFSARDGSDYDGARLVLLVTMHFALSPLVCRQAHDFRHFGRRVVAALVVDLGSGMLIKFGFVHLLRRDGLRKNFSHVFRAPRGTLLVMRAVTMFHSSGLHLACVQFLANCTTSSGDGFSDVLACGILRGLRHEERVPGDGAMKGPESCPHCRWQFYEICVAFAMHNKFLVTIVDATEFIEWSMSLVCRSCRFLRRRPWRFGRDPTVAAR